jgi:hypothetical protein
VSAPMVGLPLGRIGEADGKGFRCGRGIIGIPVASWYCGVDWSVTSSGVVLFGPSPADDVPSGRPAV